MDPAERVRQRLSEDFRQVRKQAGITQPALARKMGTSQALTWNVENSSAGIDALCRVAVALDCDIRLVRRDD